MVMVLVNVEEVVVLVGVEGVVLVGVEVLNILFQEGLPLQVVVNRHQVPYQSD